MVKLYVYMYIIITYALQFYNRKVGMYFKNVEFIRNYDGDTITVNIPNVHPIIGHYMNIRLRGVDTDEIRGNPDKKKAIEAKLFVNNILTKANKIDLMNMSRGKYFRIVADVMADGVSISDLLVENGFSEKIDYGD